MIRFLLLSVLLTLALRAVGRLLDGIKEGLQGPTVRRGSPRGVQMARDPVCGTFVVPDHALSSTEGGRPVYFCSAGCRDAYRARSSTRSGGSGRVHGRTA